jgi:nucleolar GTP-binding protein
MNFKSIPYIQRCDELLDIAFGRAAKEQPKNKIKTFSGILEKHLKKVSKGWPSLDNLPTFYYILVDLAVGVGRIKKSLGAVNWALKTLERLSKSYRYRIKKADKEASYRLRKEFYGRAASIIKTIEDELGFLGEARRKLQDLPDVEDTFTIVIAGLPNVGKSSILRALTGARPRVESYPFTTQQLLLGYFESRYMRYQVVDTPGLLDRAIDDRNPAEKQAVLALRYLANAVIYIFDPSNHCGYPPEQQLEVYREIMESFDVPVIPVVNKEDILGEEKGRVFLERNSLEDKGILCSAVDNQGIEELRNRIIDLRTSLGEGRIPPSYHPK